MHGQVGGVLIRRFHEGKVAGARTVVIRGTGLLRREFLYVDDCLCIHPQELFGSGDVGIGEDEYPLTARLPSDESILLRLTRCDVICSSVNRLALMYVYSFLRSLVAYGQVGSPGLPRLYLGPIFIEKRKRA